MGKRQKAKDKKACGCSGELLNYDEGRPDGNFEFICKDCAYVIQDAKNSIRGTGGYSVDY